MYSERPDDRAGVGEEVYDNLLEEARQVADRVLERLRALGDQLPEGVVEQIERLHGDPAGERRKTARVSDESLSVKVRAPGLPRAGASVKNHCPTGLAVLLPAPAEVGSLLRVRMPRALGGGGWVSVEVKYCRREGDGWVAGCELLGEQPPI